ncbi:MAG: respiratory chain complex I subunit 1 family protein [Bacteroidota bacterium]
MARAPRARKKAGSVKEAKSTSRLAPILLGIINKTKAFFAGRTGAPLLQPYFDLWKLLHKGAVYSPTTGFCFKAAPMVGLATAVAALLLLPAGGVAPLAFPGDLVLFAYLLGLGRFFTVAAALDTGSSFEGMGASREVLFSALAEPAFFLVLAALASRTGSLSLSSLLQIDSSAWAQAFPALLLMLVALFVVLLTENSRIPVDDPNTHLELTMIHEVMILDHGGVDLAFILYAAALRLWILGSLIVRLILPAAWPEGWFLAGMLGLAVVIGVVESSKARLQLKRVPKFIGSAAVLAALALMLVVR